MLLHEIVSAVAHLDHTVSITWSDGVTGVVDFLPIIDRGGWFTPLRDPDYFMSTMTLLPGGIGRVRFDLVWSRLTIRQPRESDPWRR